MAKLNTLSDGQSENDDLFDTEQAKEYIQFVLGSVWRRKLLAFALFAAVLGGSYGLLRASPKTYHVEATLLARRSLLLPSLVGLVAAEEDEPNLYLSILRRDNLVSLVDQFNLFEDWRTSRGPLLAFKDRLAEQISGPLPPEARTEMMVDILRQKLVATVADGAVTIAVDWPRNETAYRLVEAVQQHFLETRRVTEISSVEEAISILESHANQMRREIDVAVRQVQSGNQAIRKKRNPQIASARAPAPSVPTPDAELVRLEMLLGAKQKALADLEEYRRRRLVELQAQMAEQKAQFAPSYPGLHTIQRTIEGLSRESPEAAELRRQQQALEAEYGGRLRNLAISQPGLGDASSSSELEDPVASYSRARLGFAISSHEVLLQKIASARIQVDTARANFKYRYTVIWPARLAPSPSKPRKLPILAAAAVAGLLLGLIAAIAAESRAGRVLGPHHLRGRLGLPVLGAVEVPERGLGSAP